MNKHDRGIKRENNKDVYEILLCMYVCGDLRTSISVQFFLKSYSTSSSYINNLKSQHQAILLKQPSLNQNTMKDNIILISVNIILKKL